MATIPRVIDNVRDLIERNILPVNHTNSEIAIGWSATSRLTYVMVELKERTEITLDKGLVRSLAVYEPEVLDKFQRKPRELYMWRVALEAMISEIAQDVQNGGPSRAIWVFDPYGESGKSSYKHPEAYIVMSDNGVYEEITRYLKKEGAEPMVIFANHYPEKIHPRMRVALITKNRNDLYVI